MRKKVEEARAELRQFIDKVEHIEDLATDPDRQPVDSYPLLSTVLAEEGICLMVFCTAVDVRERLAQKNFGDLARKLPNAKIIHSVIDTVKARDAKLPSAFEGWRSAIVWAAAQSLAQEAADDCPRERHRGCGTR